MLFDGVAAYIDCRVPYRVPGRRQLVDERQLHGTQPAVDVDVEAPPQADQLLALGGCGGGGVSAATWRRRHRVVAVSAARQGTALSLGRGQLRPETSIHLRAGSRLGLAMDQRSTVIARSVVLY